MPRILEDCSSTIEIKKSKFITYLHRTNDELEAKEYLRLIKKEHPQANHHCSAMIIGSIVRSNDDGEPSQTAGHPMLDVLLHHEMQDILAVVVRYFGGTKLGTGGLVRAYSSSVQEALNKATLTESQMVSRYRIFFPYDLIGKFDHYFRSHEIQVTWKDYQEKVEYQFISQNDITTDIQELSNGQVQPEFLETIEMERPI